MSSRKQKTQTATIRSAAGEIKSRHSMEEFGPSTAGFIFCPHGEAVYYKKSWHHVQKFFTNPPNLKGKGIRFKPCPAHVMMENKQYEGEIVIKNVPVKFRRDLVNLIEGFGERAMRRDVLDRILELKVGGSEIRVTTSENQLAQKLAQKIGEVFKKQVDIKISRPKDGDVVSAIVTF